MVSTWSLTLIDLTSYPWLFLRKTMANVLRFPLRQLDQVNLNDLTTIDNFRFSERTNVYGLGVILWCMVMNETDPKEPVWTVDPEDDDTLAVQDRAGWWSDALKDLIALCLQYYPNNRPTFAEILDYIEEAMSGPVDLSDGMDNGSAPPAVRMVNMPRFGEEMYAKWSIPQPGE